MIKNKTLIDDIKSIYKSLVKEKNKELINMADLGAALKQNDINYKTSDCDKLGDFISKSNLFDIVNDTSKKAPIKYIKLKNNGKSNIRRTQNLHNPIQYASEEDVENVKRRLRLDDNFFIGQFSPQKGGRYSITDIRNSDFTKIEDKERGVKNLSISFKANDKETFRKYSYYKFTWALLKTDPLKFDIDRRQKIIHVCPKDIVENLYNGIMRYPPGAAKKITRSLDTLKKQLTQSGKEVFIYELLQNANDYPKRSGKAEGRKPIPVDVEFHITKDNLIFQHTGDYFNAKNIAAICDINDGEKADNSNTIGYKGIGFKTVFLDNDYVLLNTGTYQFRFDKSATDVINTPWQILPVWTEKNEVDTNVQYIFDQHSSEEFRVKFALKPRDKSILTDPTRDDNYVQLFKDVFESERVLLFIPYIKKVSIYIPGTSSPIIRKKDNDDWCVSESLKDCIPEEITEKINSVFNNSESFHSDGYEKIPEKYMNFHETEIKFACKKEGNKLKAVEDAILYCYLPAKRADWGFNFLMNSDMVPNGQRDDIEDIELNHIIARIAGRKFFDWIKELISCNEYDLDSIFTLIPDFDKCKDNKSLYKKFIDEFQEEFETQIKETPFIPTINNKGEVSYKCINEIICDLTGITKGNVMSDESFINMMELEEYSLPIKELRKSDVFCNFLCNYSPSELKVNIDLIKKKCEDEVFQTWLQDQNNNARFIQYWLKNDKLSEFSNKKIFIEYKGELFSANNLYSDFDSDCDDIDFLRKFVPHLHPSLKNIFSKEDNWDSFVNSEFKTFDVMKMLKDCIIYDDEALDLLKLPSNSVAFYRYLSQNEIELSDDEFLKIPYITEDGQPSLDYKNYRYFYSEEAYDLQQERWLGENRIEILSHSYFDNLNDDKKESLFNYFRKLKFNEFDKLRFVDEVITKDSGFREKVNATIENNRDFNKAFVSYVFNCGTLSKEKSLKEYVLNCIDINGNDIYLCNDNVRYFNFDEAAQNSSYEDNTKHSWIKDDMMYALSNIYFDSCAKDEAKKLVSFIRDQFDVKTFTDKSFFNDVVIKNREIIYKSIENKTSMRDFLKYLIRDAERLFDGSISFNTIKDMPLLGYNGEIIKERESNLTYIEYRDDAKVLHEKEWCPKVFVPLDPIYSNSFSEDVLNLFKIKTFDLNEIFNKIVYEKDFSQAIHDKENNVDFWRWIRNNQKEIESIENVSDIPLLDIEDKFTNPKDLYISDTYQEDKIENLVKRYIHNAQFVSSKYGDDSDSATKEKKEGWIKLFKKIGLKSDNLSSI